MDLLIRFGVHEVIVIAILVEILHRDLIHHDAVDRIRRPKAIFEHRIGAQVSQLRLDKGAKVAGGAVLDAKDKVQVLVVLDDHTRTHLCGWNGHSKISLLTLVRNKSAVSGVQSADYCDAVTSHLDSTRM